MVDIDDLRRHGADPEVLRGIHLDPKIVPARSEAGKVHEGIDGIRPQADQRVLAAAHGDPRGRGRNGRAQAGAEIPPAHRHVAQIRSTGAGRISTTTPRFAAASAAPTSRRRRPSRRRERARGCRSP